MDPLHTIKALEQERAALYQRWGDPLWAFDGPRRLLELDALLDQAWHERRRLCARCRAGLTEDDAATLIASSDVEDRMHALALMEIQTGKTAPSNAVQSAGGLPPAPRQAFPRRLAAQRDTFVMLWQTTTMTMVQLAARFEVGKETIEWAIRVLRSEGLERPAALSYHGGKSRRGVGNDRLL